MFSFAPSAASASGANAGATITSTNWRSRMAAAVAASSGRLKAMMPPKADVVSAFVRPQVSLFDGGGDGRAAGIRVLHDHAGGRLELAHALERRVGIRDVVVGELLALELPRRRDGCAGRERIGVERRGLVRILAVAQVLELPKARRKRIRERRIALLATEPAGRRGRRTGPCVQRSLPRGAVASPRRRHRREAPRASPA